MECYVWKNVIVGLGLDFCQAHVDDSLFHVRSCKTPSQMRKSMITEVETKSVRFQHSLLVDNSSAFSSLNSHDRNSPNIGFSRTLNNVLCSAYPPQM